MGRTGATIRSGAFRVGPEFGIANRRNNPNQTVCKRVANSEGKMRLGEPGTSPVFIFDRGLWWENVQT